MTFINQPEICNVHTTRVVSLSHQRSQSLCIVSIEITKLFDNFLSKRMTLPQRFLIT